MLPCVQLFSVHAELERDVAGTLARIAGTGFREVEPYGFAPDVEHWRRELATAGLSAPSGHTAVLGEDLGQVLDAAEALGIGTVIDPHVDDDRWSDRESIRAVATELSAAAQVAADRGISIGYHNHDTEVARRVDGASVLEVLAEELDEAVVLQVDAYWVEIAGASAPELIGRLGDRVTSLHLKDGPARGAGAEQVALGEGSQPLEAILAAAPGARRIVELDSVAGDVFADLESSRRWLDAHA